MTNSARRFLVLICAGTFAAECAARRRNHRRKGSDNNHGRGNPKSTKTGSSSALAALLMNGDRAQFEQEHRLPGDQLTAASRIYITRGTVGKDGLFRSMVTRSGIPTITTYTLQLSKPKLGYIKAGFTEFRSWYDGNGGFFPHDGGTFFPPPFPEMHIDRGDAWIELGLRVPDWPEITIRYAHEFRDGQKDSTTWGDTTLTGLAVNPTRKIVPSFRDIDEKRDIVSLEISKTFGNTDVLLGMRYEHTKDDDSLNMERNAGQVGVVPGGQRFVTQQQNDDVDLFSGHGITVTRFSDSLWFTAGYSYTTLTNDLSGSRIFGTSFDSAFGEPVPTLGSRDHAFIDLAGTAQVKENLFNANLFWMPLESLTVLTGFRYTHENLDTDSTFSCGGTGAKHAAVYPNESGRTDSITDLRNSDLGRGRPITIASLRGWSCATPVSRIGFSMPKANGKRNTATSMRTRT